MPGEEIAHVDALMQTIVGATKGYFATDDAGLQDTYHKAAETAREELLDMGYGGLAAGLGEERTLAEKESTVAGWWSYVRARAPTYEDFSKIVTPTGLPAAGDGGGGGFLGNVQDAVSNVVKAAGGTAGALAEAVPTLLRWLPWILGGLFASQIFRVKIGGGRR